MKRKTKMNRLIKNNRKSFILLIVVLLFFAYLIIKMLPMRSSFVVSEVHTFTETSKAYIFRDEEYAILNSAEKINFLVPESDKISASTVLSDNYKITTNYYIKEKIEIINFVLDNPDITIRSLNRKISQARAECDSLNADMENVSSPLEEKQIADKLYSLQHEIYIMKRAQQYTYATSDELYELRNEYEALLNDTDIPLTADNLNFNVFGSAYYSIDGYENYMNFESLNYLDVAYLNELDCLVPDKTLANGSYVFKSCSNSRAVIVMRLPADTYVSAEEACLKIYGNIVDDYDMDSEGGYINFVFRRIDMLNIFPAFKFETAKGEVYDGELIKVSYQDDEKVLFVALRNNVASLSASRLFTAYPHVVSYDCYVIDKNCIFEEEGKSYVRAVRNAVNEEIIEVNVFTIKDGKAYLKKSENESISEGDEIKLRGLL